MQLGRLLGRFLMDFGSKMEVFGRSWGPKNQEKSILGGVLGGLGGILGPKSQKGRARSNLKHEFGPPNGGENRSKIHPEAIEKVIVFLITFGIDFWSDLVPTWLPKPSQNGAKLVPKSMQVGMLIWHLFWKGSWFHFCWFFTSTCQGWSTENLQKT